MIYTGKSQNCRIQSFKSFQCSVYMAENLTSVLRYNTASPKAPLPKVRILVYGSSDALPSLNVSSAIMQAEGNHSFNSSPSASSEVTGADLFSNSSSHLTREIPARALVFSKNPRVSREPIDHF